MGSRIVARVGDPSRRRDAGGRCRRRNHRLLQRHAALARSHRSRRHRVGRSVARRAARQRLVRILERRCWSARAPPTISVSHCRRGTKAFDRTTSRCSTGGRMGGDDVPQRARSAAVPRRRNGVDETLHAPSHRRGHRVARGASRAAAGSHHASRQRRSVRNDRPRSTRTVSPKRRGRFRRKRSSATTRSKSRDADSNWHESGHFKVEQFRLPTIRATVSGPADAQLRPAEVRSICTRLSLGRRRIAAAGEGAHDRRTANAELPGLRRLSIRRRGGDRRNHANRRRRVRLRSRSGSANESSRRTSFR